VLSNAFQVRTSALARLDVSSVEVGPQFLLTLEDRYVFEGQNATFQSVATGLPQPAYHWRFDDKGIPGANQRSHTISGAQLTDSGRYSVIASNAWGAITNEARLIVTPRPRLAITEVMSSPTNFPPNNHEDWWELTNVGSEGEAPVDLFGYRFDDNTIIAAQGAKPRLDFAWTNTHHIFIAPGESIIFVENMSAEAFRSWWGASNLRPDLQIVTYEGTSLNFSPQGDGIGLWNMGAFDDDDVVVIPVATFSIAIPGVSFTYCSVDPDLTCCFCSSEPEVNGAFVAEESDDVGSPGYIRTPIEPRILSIAREAGGCRILWRTLAGRSYSVQCKESLGGATWIPLGTLTSFGTSLDFLDVISTDAGQRFYRVVLEPSPP
jgi:hypothetical protein